MRKSGSPIPGEVWIDECLPLCYTAIDAAPEQSVYTKSIDNKCSFGGRQPFVRNDLFGEETWIPSTLFSRLPSYECRREMSASGGSRSLSSSNSCAIFARRKRNSSASVYGLNM